jgi:uncharacterized membrane protein YebE (DUF533 family)
MPQPATTAHKFLIALAAAAGVFATAMSDGHLDGSEMSGIIIAFVGAFFVWAIPNKPIG